MVRLCPTFQIELFSGSPDGAGRAGVVASLPALGARHGPASRFSQLARHGQICHCRVVLSPRRNETCAAYRDFWASSDNLAHGMDLSSIVGFWALMSSLCSRMASVCSRMARACSCMYGLM